MRKETIVPKDKKAEVMARWNSFLCKVKGHSWRYNFPFHSWPDKVMCRRCKEKHVLDLKQLEWNKVESFSFVNDSRTDEELAEQWFDYEDE